MKLEDCRKKLEELEKAREELLGLLREMRIASSKSIVLVHAGDLDLAGKLLKEALEIYEKVKNFTKYPEIYYSLTHDSLQELVEALFFFRSVRGEEADIEIEEPSAIITGLADVIGELRRFSLSKMIEGKFDLAEKMLNLMEKIYKELVSFASFPDRLVPNLRQKLDVARASIERTKSDLLVAKLYASLDRLG